MCGTESSRLPNASCFPPPPPPPPTSCDPPRDPPGGRSETPAGTGYRARRHQSRPPRSPASRSCRRFAEHQVEMGACTSVRADRKPVHVVPVFGERGNDFGSDFEAAGSDRGADDGRQSRGRGACLGGQRAGGFPDDAHQRSAPARVSRGHCPGDGVGKQHRHAVGRFDRDAGSRGSSHQGVAGGWIRVSPSGRPLLVPGPRGLAAWNRGRGRQRRVPGDPGRRPFDHESRGGRHPAAGF